MFIILYFIPLFSAGIEVYLRSLRINIIIIIGFKKRIELKKSSVTAPVDLKAVFW